MKGRGSWKNKSAHMQGRESGEGEKAIYRDRQRICYQELGQCYIQRSAKVFFLG